MTLIDISDLSIRFGQQLVLENIQLSIKTNDFIIFTGPNGGGKTTLLRVLAGLQSYQKGSVHRTKDITIGYLPQNRTIDRDFPITVEEVLLTGLQNKKKWWQPFTANDRLLCQNMLERLELCGYGNRPIIALSGGQWQRVLLGRALISQPDLLLLDEPESYLDKQGKAFLYTLLEEQQSRSTIVLVSHEHTLPQKTIYEIKDTHLQLCKL